MCAVRNALCFGNSATNIQRDVPLTLRAPCSLRTACPQLDWGRAAFWLIAIFKPNPTKQSPFGAWSPCDVSLRTPCSLRCARRPSAVGEISPRVWCCRTPMAASILQILSTLTIRQIGSLCLSQTQGGA